MEIWQIVGIEFNSKFKGDDGSLVSGIRLHLIGEPEPGTGVTGKQVRNQFISNQSVTKHDIKPEIGKTITFEFNRFGNICKVEVS